MNTDQYEIQTIKNWPQHSNGAWVVSMLRKFLERHQVPDVDIWLDTPFNALGNKNAVQYVQWAVKEGGVESYADAWHDVLGLAHRMYE